MVNANQIPPTCQAVLSEATPPGDNPPPPPPRHETPPGSTIHDRAPFGVSVECRLGDRSNYNIGRSQRRKTHTISSRAAPDRWPPQHPTGVRKRGRPPRTAAAAAPRARASEAAGPAPPLLRPPERAAAPEARASEAAGPRRSRCYAPRAPGAGVIPGERARSKAGAAPSPRWHALEMRRGAASQALPIPNSRRAPGSWGRAHCRG